jgi:small subunit ribosomal protein S8
MTTNYILADMFTRIRNGQQVKQSSVKQPKSILCMKVLEVLVEEGVIQNFRLDPDNPHLIEILLCYYEDKPVIQEITCISKPGHRVYSNVKNLWRLQRGLGFFVLSTPKGVLSDRKARENNVGGEILCKVL